MNRDCHGDLMRPAYYRCLLDSTVIEVVGDPAKVPESACPRCGRTIIITPDVVECQTRTVEQIRLPGGENNSWLDLQSDLRLEVR
jgi:hypothetical protein